MAGEETEEPWLGRASAGVIRMIVLTSCVLSRDTRYAARHIKIRNPHYAIYLFVYSIFCSQFMHVEGYNQVEKLEAARSAYLRLPLFIFDYLLLPFITFCYLWLPLVTFGYSWLHLVTFPGLTEPF